MKKYEITLFVLVQLDPGVITRRLEAAGFDLHKPIRREESLDRQTYTYTQEEDSDNGGHSGSGGD